MKIGCFLEWKVGTLDPEHKQNVLGEEILALGLCKYLKQIDGVESAEVYAPNSLPDKKLDVMIYMNYITPCISELAHKNVCYVQNAFDEKGNMNELDETIKTQGFDSVLCYSQKLFDFFKEKDYDVHFLPFGVDTEIYRPVGYDEKLDYEIAYVGNNIKGKERTEKFLAPAMKFNFGLFGNWGAKTTDISSKVAFHRLLKCGEIIPFLIWLKNNKIDFNGVLAQKSQGKISQEDMITLLSSSKILLNFTHSGAIEFDVLNYRILEILACKGFVITDRVPVVEKLLKGCVVFTSGGKDLERKVKYYLKHPEKRKAIAQKGYEYVIKYGTAEARADELFSVLKQI